MVFTRKFSEFVPAPVDMPVGLTGGANSIGPSGSGGGGGDNIVIITQPNDFIPGQWVRIDAASQLYMLALGDNPKDAESWWLVIAASATQFTIQGGTSHVDFSKFASVVPGILPFTVGAPQYISQTTLGAMSYDIPTTLGGVNKPVFIADGPTTGWILSARGYIVGVNQGNPNMCNMVIVTQPGNGFALGDVIYATTTANTYAKAISSGTFAQSDRVGIVVTPGDPVFTFQTEGNAPNAITADDVGAPINPGVRYWLSPTVAGKVTATQPTGPGQYSVPVYVPYSTTSGIITPQRSLLGSTASPNASSPIFLGNLNAGNGYASTNILADANGNLFNAYQIILMNPNGLDVIYANGGGNTAFGFQMYWSTSGYQTNTVYSHYLYGVNSTANPTTTGVLYGNVNNSSAESSLILSAAVNTTASLTSLDAILHIDGRNIPANSFGRIQYDSWVVDNVAAPLPMGIGYGATGIAVGGAGGTGQITGLRLVATAGATITAGPSYFAIFGLPNV